SPTEDVAGQQRRDHEQKRTHDHRHGLGTQRTTLGEVGGQGQRVDEDEHPESEQERAQPQFGVFPPPAAPGILGGGPLDGGQVGGVLGGRVHASPNSLSTSATRSLSPSRNSSTAAPVENASPQPLTRSASCHRSVHCTAALSVDEFMPAPPPPAPPLPCHSPPRGTPRTRRRWRTRHPSR